MENHDISVLLHSLLILTENYEHSLEEHVKQTLFGYWIFIIWWVLLVCRKPMCDFIVCCHHSACQERSFLYDQFIDALYVLALKLSTICNGKIVKTMERTIIYFSFSFFF